MRISFFSVLLLLGLLAPCLAQPLEDEDKPEVRQGYIYQTGMTQDSYLISNAEQLKTFVGTLPPVVPYKILPAPPNPDPFLTGFTVDFEESVIVVAVAQNRISKHPSYAGTEELNDGSREVRFVVSAPTAEAYPFGWAVYSAVVLPRIEGRTSVVVEKSLTRAKSW